MKVTLGVTLLSLVSCFCQLADNSNSTESKDQLSVPRRPPTVDQIPNTTAPVMLVPDIPAIIKFPEFCSHLNANRLKFRLHQLGIVLGEADAYKGASHGFVTILVVLLKPV